MTWRSTFNSRIEKALDAYITAQTDSQRPVLPVDIDALARAAGNIDIERREMIREAAVGSSGGRFRIYLQSNFLDRPGARIRQRFSLAHEIAHTFLFIAQDDVLKPTKGGPRGINLESACHEGARRLLIPERFLSRELGPRHDGVRGEEIIRMAKRVFDVSVEVFLRRLGDRLDSSETCFALSRNGSLQFAMYPAWLKTVLWSPPGDTPIIEWLKSSDLRIEPRPDGSYLGAKSDVALVARRIVAGTDLNLFEIRRCSVAASSAWLLPPRTELAGGDTPAIGVAEQLS